MRVLIVEDDRELASILERALEEALYTVDVANDGETARHLALHEEFSAVLLDLMIPGIDGIAVCRALRSAGNRAPVIMLTARDAIRDRVQGLDAGADDYVVKPFSIEELLARLRAHLRRSSREPAAVICTGKLSLDPRSTHVQYGSRRIELTAREFALLHFFMLHPNQVLTRAEILENVWGSRRCSELGNVVEVYVNYLRNKLESSGEPRIIQTVRGRGYLLESR